MTALQIISILLMAALAFGVLVFVIIIVKALGHFLKKIIQFCLIVMVILAILLFILSWFLLNIAA
ncbi:MAG: hypothetical protein RMJ33_07620 [Saprospiraceae bacterium]|nr:hypothetical protein [Saprospiraceae bacterium]MDW8229691.1 hypothetical protein [Saprospiraceae bacterium]